MDSFHLSLLFQVLPSKHVFPVPAVKPEYITLPISALTAAISLDKVKKKPFLLKTHWLGLEPLSNRSRQGITILIQQL